MGMVDLSVGSFINESTTPPSGPEVRRYCWGRVVPVICPSLDGPAGPSGWFPAYALGRSVVLAGFEIAGAYLARQRHRASKKPRQFPAGA